MDTPWLVGNSRRREMKGALGLAPLGSCGWKSWVDGSHTCRCSAHVPFELAAGLTVCRRGSQSLIWVWCWAPGDGCDPLEAHPPLYHALTEFWLRPKSRSDHEWTI